MVHVVSLLVFYCDNSSSNPAKVYNFYAKNIPRLATLPTVLQYPNPWFQNLPKWRWLTGFESRTCFEHVQTFWTRLSPPKSFSRFLHFGKTFSIGLEWVSLGSTTKWRFITWRFVRCGFIWFSVTRWLYYYSIFGHLQNDKLPSNIKMTKLEQHFDKNHPQKLPKDF